MDTFTQDMQRLIEKMVVDLKDDDDFMPFMHVVDHRGEAHLVGMVMPEDVAEKNALADVMTSICCIRRATKVAFGSIAWQIIRHGENLDDIPAPSECADREEVVFLTIVDGSDCEYYTASLVRVNKLVGVGLWEKMPTTTSWQRFSDAIRMGMEMAKSMPPDVAEYVDSMVDAEQDHLLAEKIARMIVETREAILRHARESDK